MSSSGGGYIISTVHPAASTAWRVRVLPSSARAVTLRANGLVINSSPERCPAELTWTDITGAIGEQYGSFNLTKSWGGSAAVLQTAATYSTRDHHQQRRVATGGRWRNQRHALQLDHHGAGRGQVQLNTSDALGYNNGNLLTVAGTLKQACSRSRR